jgi:hypothetical protein
MEPYKVSQTTQRMILYQNDAKCSRVEHHPLSQRNIVATNAKRNLVMTTKEAQLHTNEAYRHALYIKL